MEYQLIKSDYQYVPMSAVERVLTNRGIDKHDIPHYLNTTDSDILDPLLLDNMEKGAAMLATCIRDNKRLFLQVDSDCDGFTSAAVFLNYLNRLFPSFVQNNIIYRLHDGK